MNPYKAVIQEMNMGCLQCGGGVGTRSRMCHGVWGGRQVGQMLLFIYENSNRQAYGSLFRVRSIYVHYKRTYMYIKIKAVPECSQEIKVPRYLENGAGWW